MRTTRYNLSVLTSLLALPALGPTAHAADPPPEPTVSPPTLPALPPAPVPAPAASSTSITTTETAGPPAPEFTPPSLALSMPNRHQGFYLRGLMGTGYMSAFGDGPRGSASISGVANYGGIAIGGSPVAGFAVAGLLWGAMTSADFSGGPFSQWTLVMNSGGPTTKNASNTAMVSLAQIGILADWFPDPAGGWHLGASVGLGLAGVLNHADESQMGGAALAGSVFGGHSWWIGRSWSLGVEAVAAGATAASLSDTSGHGTGYRLTPLTLGLQVSTLYY